MNDINNERNVQFAFYNYEMTPEQVLAKLLGIYLYEKYGEILTYKDIFSRGKKDGEPNILSDEYYELIKECTPILELFASKLTFFPEARTADSHIDKLFEWLQRWGEFDNPLGSFEDNKYTPHDPNQILGVVTDHLNLLSGTNLKAAIDNVANTHVIARNMCGIVTFIDIMQLNRGASGDARIRAGMPEPRQSDFSDSSVAYHGSQTVLTLFDPGKAQLSQHRHYNVAQLNGRYISLLCLKNRFGSSNIADALAYYGEVTTFAELPHPSQILDYERYTNPDWLISTDQEEKPKKLSNFKL